jgi:hypothetical protein
VKAAIESLHFRSWYCYIGVSHQQCGKREGDRRGNLRRHSKESDRFPELEVGYHGSRQSREQTHAWLIDARRIRLGEAKLWGGALGSITVHASITSPTRLNDIVPMGTQHRGTRWGRARCAKDFLLLMRVELKPFRGEPDIPNRKRLELATGEGTKGLFLRCSFTTDVVH